MDEKYVEEMNRPVVVITGSSGGVGRATARAYAKKGAKIGLIARGHTGLEAAKKEVESLGGEAMILPLDVADPQQVEAAAQKVADTWGNIDIWVNNAMVSVFAEVKDITPEEFERVTKVTYLGQVYGTMAALKRMLPVNRGSIVLVGSALAYRGIPLQSAYCGAKHGIQGFFDSLKAELIHDKSKIKLSMVQLPGLNTTQFGWTKSKMPNKARPLGGIYQPEVAAEGIIYAAETGIRNLMVSKDVIQTILGDRLAPGILDQVLGKIGYKGQQTHEPEDPNRADNLWSPVEEDRGAHGPFDGEAKGFSPQLWATKNKGKVIAGAAMAGAVVAGIALITGKNKRKASEQSEQQPYDKAPAIVEHKRKIMIEDCR